MSGLYFIRTKIINKKLVELSEKLGISKQAISGWEQSKRKIPQKRLEQLVELTGIPAVFFLIDNVSEKDKLEIEKYYLTKRLEEIRRLEAC